MVFWFLAPSCLGLFDWSRKEAYQAVRFEKESRYYVILLEKDLLEDWTITIVNGRIKTKLGQSRTQAFPSYSKAFDQFCSLAKTRYQRGYSPKTFISKSTPLLQLLLALLQIDKQDIPNSKIKTKTRATSKSRLANSAPPKEINPQLGFDF